MRSRTFIVAAAIVLGSVVSAQAATTWDAYTDFNSTSNTASDTWQYMAVTKGANTDYALLPTYGVFPYFSFYGWQQPGNFPAVGVSGGEIKAHPDIGWAAVIGWMSPISGHVDVTFSVADRDFGANGAGDHPSVPYDGVDYFLFNQGDTTALATGYVANGGDSGTIGVSGIAVSSGTMLYLQIGHGTDNNWYDLTGVGFTVTQSTVPEPVPVTWTGGGSTTTWSAAPGSNNWKDTAGGAAADYADGVAVTFDDSATGGLTADISTADVTPSSVVFNNTTKDFVVTGTKGIAGTTGVLKQGTGRVTLNGVNTYSGVTTVQAGTLQMSEYAYGNVATNGGADIQGGKGILDYSLSGTSPAPEVQALLTASYNNGAWDIGFIRNTTAATTGLTLGWKDDITLSQVTIMATYAGDVNVDGQTDVADLTALLNNYNKTGMVWANGDFNYDGTVNVADLTALLNNYNKSIGAGIGLSSSVVPEPGTLALLVTGLLGLLAYAWRKRK